MAEQRARERQVLLHECLGVLNVVRDSPVLLLPLAVGSVELLAEVPSELDQERLVERIDLDGLGLDTLPAAFALFDGFRR